MKGFIYVPTATNRVLINISKIRMVEPAVKGTSILLEEIAAPAGYKGSVQHQTNGSTQDFKYDLKDSVVRTELSFDEVCALIDSATK